VNVYNVVAVLPGTMNEEQRILIGAHYDSVNRTATPRGRPGDPPPPVRDPNIDAPGVSDDASGVACAMELARVMSQYQFEKTLVFIAFAGEEDGEVGSTLYAAKTKSLNRKIEAVLNNDMIGSDVGGNGRTENRRVNVFSEGPIDSPSREIARYVKEIGERYLPSMTVNPVFRADRFGRDGDQRPFYREGFGAEISRHFGNGGALWPEDEYSAPDARQVRLRRAAQVETSESGTGSGGIRRADAQDDGSLLGTRNLRGQRE
jgi:Zn-dependent M28 family amino/carboxypeptidase